MTLRIFREGKPCQLIPELLARELRITGTVVFTSGRVRQRGIAQEIKELLLSQIDAREIETCSPNDCMCVFDPERFSLEEVLKLASDADAEFEKIAHREWSERD